MNIVDCKECTHDRVCKYKGQKDEVLQHYKDHNPEYPFTMRFECQLFSQVVAIPRSGIGTPYVHTRGTGDPTITYTEIYSE